MSNPTAIRDAIAAIIPSDSPMVADVKLHDGLAAITIKCGTLRWSQDMAIAGQEPEQMAAVVDAQFKSWLRTTLSNLKDNEGRVLHTHRRSVVSIRNWMNEHPERREWLNSDLPITSGRTRRPKSAAVHAQEAKLEKMHAENV